MALNFRRVPEESPVLVTPTTDAPHAALALMSAVTAAIAAAIR
jgi:hypothetical protein